MNKKFVSRETLENCKCRHCGVNPITVRAETREAVLKYCNFSYTGTETFFYCDSCQHKLKADDVFRGAMVSAVLKEEANRLDKIGQFI